MRILICTSEVHPYSRATGLADMTGALALSLSRAGHSVAVVTPLYAGMRERFPDIHPVDCALEVPLGSSRVEGKVWSRPRNPQLTFYFVDQPGFFQRRGLYEEEGKEYWDNAERFVFFSKSVVYLAQHLPFKPQLIHAHDWQTGLVAALLHHEKQEPGRTTGPRVCFTIHQLAAQGQFGGDKFLLTNLPLTYFQSEALKERGGINCLKAGLVFADHVTTPGPRYAQQIMTPEFGQGLDRCLWQRRSTVSGIVNGVDYEVWRTAKNPFLKHSFSKQQLSSKTAEKLDLQLELGLPRHPLVPLFGTFRPSDELNAEVLWQGLEAMLGNDLQFVLLASRPSSLEPEFRRLVDQHPNKVALRSAEDQPLVHRIQAAADFCLMPNSQEPGSSAHLSALRYGAIPIAAAGGAIDDTVVDITEDRDRANGIKLYEFSTRGVAHAIRKALALFQTPELLQHYRVNAMGADFSWERTALEYLRLYDRMLR